MPPPPPDMSRLGRWLPPTKGRPTCLVSVGRNARLRLRYCRPGSEMYGQHTGGRAEDGSVPGKGGGRSPSGGGAAGRCSGSMVGSGRGVVAESLRMRPDGRRCLFCRRLRAEWSGAKEAASAPLCHHLDLAAAAQAQLRRRRPSRPRATQTLMAVCSLRMRAALVAVAAGRAVRRVRRSRRPCHGFPRPRARPSRPLPGVASAAARACHPPRHWAQGRRVGSASPHRPSCAALAPWQRRSLIVRRARHGPTRPPARRAAAAPRAALRGQERGLLHQGLDPSQPSRVPSRSAYRSQGACARQPW